MSNSGFQDTFTKNEGEQNLQYDDSAFYFFSTTLLSVILIPYVIYLYRYYKSFKKINARQIPISLNKYNRKALNEIKKRRLLPTSFFMKLLLLGLMLYSLYFCASKAKESTNFKTFDPYEILGADESSTDEEIRRKYKKLALKYHPDKNPGDPDAYQRFLLINKAYQCMESEEAKAKCLEYGNPDGRGMYEVGIALPSFLLNKENRSVILAIFFIILLVIIPSIFMYFYQSSEKIDKFGSDRSLFLFALRFLRNENIIFKNFIEIISCSQELRTILAAKPEQKAHLHKLINRDFIPKMGVDRFRNFLKPFYLLYAYMTNEYIHPSLQDDLYFILKESVKLLNSLLDISIEIYSLPEEHVKKLLGNKLKFEVIERLISFSQHFYQGLWLHDMDVLQLPGIQKDNLERFKRKFKKNITTKAILTDTELQTKLLTFFADDNEVQVELQNVFKTMTMLDIDLKMVVKLDNDETDDKVYQGDVYTMVIKITRKNPVIGYIHSKNLPFFKLENLIILIQDPLTNNIVYYKKVASLEQEVVEEYSQFAQNHGKGSLRVKVMSDSYVGLDQDKLFDIEILPMLKKPEEPEIHPDDQKAIKEGSFIKSLFEGLDGDADDSEEEEEEEETENKEIEKPKLDDIKEETDGGEMEDIKEEKDDDGMEDIKEEK